MANWIDGFLEYTNGLSSPPIFRKWAAITTIGAALERRVYTLTAKGPTFPNLYIILIGRPGIGKSEAINACRTLIRATKSDGIYEQVCHLAPTDVTKASLYDYLASSKIRRLGPDPEAEALEMPGDFHYHSAFLAVSELSDLIRDHDTQLLGALHGLYDCLPFVEEERRYRADNPIKIPRAQISLLGGTTPAYISRTFPPQAWDEGFMARTILIYSADYIEPDLFGAEELDPLVSRELVEDLRQIGQLRGRYGITDAAKQSITAWQKGGRQPAPNHIRLEHYNTRRLRHAIKLSIIAAANHTNRTIIDVPDFQEALSWMIEAEQVMPQVFMEMVGKSDNQTLNELYHFARGLWEGGLMKGQPIRRGILANFVRRKVPSYQIDSIIDTAVSCDMLIKCPTSTGEIRYKPADKPQLYMKR